jgi:hypothetical protein
MENLDLYDQEDKIQSAYLSVLYPADVKYHVNSVFLNYNLKPKLKIIQKAIYKSSPLGKKLASLNEEFKRKSEVRLEKNSVYRFSLRSSNGEAFQKIAPFNGVFFDINGDNLHFEILDDTFKKLEPERKYFSVPLLKPTGKFFLYDLASAEKIGEVEPPPEEPAAPAATSVAALPEEPFAPAATSVAAPPAKPSAPGATSVAALPEEPFGPTATSVAALPEEQSAPATVAAPPEKPFAPAIVAAPPLLPVETLANEPSSQSAQSPLPYQPVQGAADSPLNELLTKIAQNREQYESRKEENEAEKNAKIAMEQEILRQENEKRRKEFDALQEERERERQSIISGVQDVQREFKGKRREASAEAQIELGKSKAELEAGLKAIWEKRKRDFERVESEAQDKQKTDEAVLKSFGRPPEIPLPTPPPEEADYEWQLGKSYRVKELATGTEQTIHINCHLPEKFLVGFKNEKGILGFTISDQQGRTFLQNYPSSEFKIIEMLNEQDVPINESKEYFYLQFKVFVESQQNEPTQETVQFLKGWGEKPFRPFPRHVDFVKRECIFEERDGSEYSLSLDLSLEVQHILNEEGMMVEVADVGDSGTPFCFNAQSGVIGCTNEVDGPLKNKSVVLFAYKADSFLNELPMERFVLFTCLHTTGARNERVINPVTNFEEFCESLTHLRFESEMTKAYLKKFLDVKSALDRCNFFTNNTKRFEANQYLDSLENLQEVQEFVNGVLFVRPSKPVSSGGRRTLFKKTAPLACTSRPGGNGCLSAFSSRRARRPHPHLSAARFQTRRSTPPSAALSRRGRIRAPNASNR